MSSDSSVILRVVALGEEQGSVGFLQQSEVRQELLVVLPALVPASLFLVVAEGDGFLHFPFVMRDLGDCQINSILLLGRLEPPFVFLLDRALILIVFEILKGLFGSAIGSVNATVLQILLLDQVAVGRVWRLMALLGFFQHAKLGLAYVVTVLFIFETIF